ncbi:secretion protein HlyD [Desulfosarcina ovata subsp. sediminis]|uniref:Secretion protein HlyD n=1 Tax=Desulfosarcina ovata subsp. sediminis TaxID=885957 RepID=A0A5K7ZJJ9_9BACT|nr:efflux RND transporter periplasmic adaptor subunit [Desulfosarcina ovata]BBO82322.1 secretion protein HlyD [Desulfosarcina ovata subsp. sediminis]
MNDSNSLPDPEIAETLGLEDGGGRRHRFPLLLVFLFLIVAGAVFWIWRHGEVPKSRTKYKTEAAQRDHLTVSVTATGNLVPTNQVEVGSELSGIVERVNVDYNDRVEVGQPLAILDTTKLKAKVLQSKASLASARAKVLSARATVEEARNQVGRLDRFREISGSKAVSQNDLDAAKAALTRARADEAMAEAAVELAAATLEEDKTDLSKAVIVSPVNGIVLSRDVEPGQTVAASLQAPVLFTLAEDLTRMELIVDVDEADVGAVNAGQAAEFTVDAYSDRRYPAHVTQVRYGAKTVDGVVTYATVLNVDNSDLTLRPGMTATAEITVEQVVDALLIPNAALRFSPPTDGRERTRQKSDLIQRLLSRRPRTGSNRRPSSRGDERRKRHRVWRLNDNQLSPVFITIGVTDGTRTVVTGGELAPGDHLVVDWITVTP